MSAFIGEGRYDTSPLKIFNVQKGAAEGLILSHSFDPKSDMDFGKYGFPNQMQIRNGSTNKLELEVNGDENKTFQIPPLLFETYNFEDETIKYFRIRNLDDFDTDDLIQVVVAKEITQNMVNKLIYEKLNGR
ncbi:hypothetical protein MmiEs2_04910 [Methanimicrococcus stummii]|uniref:Uncharacterized protein n=1 Tax=Methanimicrococcus stummii TaxID=3028294 RepID=A0AA96VHH9_9EURY|nr:hypothetical protein [Methanimicrococcus sp. Es2]WNY28306.1 hypothetical protein MmiEs2_04910 [Methanimicrococcus sp. Es2]